MQIDLVMSIDTLYRFVDQSLLPVQLGGSLEHSHQLWVDFRLVSMGTLDENHVQS